MERTPGPLLYEILKYSGLKYVVMLELFSTTIAAKLAGNLSAF